MADEQQQQFDLTTAAHDPDFLHAGMADKVAFLSAHDADFGKADPKDQAGYINHILGNDKQEEPKSTYQKLTDPFDSGAQNPVTRTLSSAGAAFMQTPEMVKNLVAHPIDTLKGMGSQVVDSAKAWADPSTRPTWEGIKSVLPEAIGGGIGSLAGGEATGAVTGTIPKIAGVAGKVVEPMRGALRDRIFQELPKDGPKLTPGVAKIAKGAGAFAGGELGGYPGGVAGYVAGPKALEAIAGTPEIGDIRNPGPFSEIPKTMPKPGVGKIEEGPTAPQHAAVRAGQSQVNKLAERKVVPLRESPVPEPEPVAEEEGTIPVIGAPKGGKGGKGGANAPESGMSGSEGTAARWTNDYVMEQARKGNRTAIEQSARRGLPLPENARYVMGDVDLPRVVLNPKEVTRFTPEGTPIRDMSRPEVSSRSRIQPVGDANAIPPIEPLFQTPSTQVPSGTMHAAIHMDPVNPEPAAAAPRVEGVLPGMEADVAKQAEGAAKVKGEELTQQANTPKNVDAAAGEMESKSPLFRGTAASPQQEIFAPGGQEPASPAAGEPPTAEELRPEHADLPAAKAAFQKARQAERDVENRYYNGKATQKEFDTAKKDAEKALQAFEEAEGREAKVDNLDERLNREAERNTPERIDAARDLIFDTIQKLKELERGGPSWSDYTEETRPTANARDFRKGEFYGGKAGSIPSGRATIPWLRNRPKWGWSKLEAAMMTGRSSKLQTEIMRAADDYLQGQTPEGKAAIDKRMDEMVRNTPPPPPDKFVNFQKPTRLEPPAAEAAPAAAEPPQAPPVTGNFPKTARFSKTQWERFTPDRQNAEIALAKRRGQSIDIYTKR